MRLNTKAITQAILPTGFLHTRDPPCACQQPETYPAHIKFSQVSTRTPTDRASVVFSYFELWFSFSFFLYRFRSQSIFPSSICPERHSHKSQKFSGFLVRLCRGNNSDIHTSHLADFIIIYLWKDNLLF